MLVDTDVFIWLMRANQKARKAIDKIDDIRISNVTYIELVQGMRNKTELRNLRNALAQLEVEIFQLNEDISARAAYLVESLFLSHDVRLADALIGATAIHHGLPLLTGNTNHFKAMPNLELKRFRP